MLEGYGFVIRGLLPTVAQASRVKVSADQLKIALQCGGADGFSDISGNPLAAWVAKEIIRCGGTANPSESPELFGVEVYVLEKVRIIDTVRRFLTTVERFKARASIHGMTFEANTSGSNKLWGQTLSGSLHVIETLAKHLTETITGLGPVASMSL